MKVEIKVSGILSKDWEMMFEGMDIIQDGNISIIKADVPDTSYLHGILNLIRDLNLKLLSLNTEDNK